jgi:hypothetical protein
MGKDVVVEWDQKPVPMISREKSVTLLATDCIFWQINLVVTGKVSTFAATN